MNKKRILVTHNDGDGVGCAVIYSKCFPNTEVHFVSYLEVNEHVAGLIAFLPQDMPIMITDMSVDEDVAKLLDIRGHVEMVDHHHTADWMNKYQWALVDTACSATKLLYNMMKDKFHIEDYTHFVDLINDYDTWGDGKGPSDRSLKLNTLFRIMGIDKFFSKFMTSGAVRFTKTDELLLDIDSDKKKAYIEKSMEIMVLMKDPSGNRYAIVPVEQYVNDVCHHILNTDMGEKSVEYVMAVNFREQSISLRGKGNVNVGELAKLAGGGGHKKSAGLPMSDHSLVTMVFACGGNCGETTKLRKELGKYVR